MGCFGRERDDGFSFYDSPQQLEKSRAVIGSGGATIKGLQSDFDVSINIDEDGKVMIGANNSEVADNVVAAINAIIKDVETGDVYNAKVVKLMNFGAFAEILPGKQGLIHISEISTERVENVESVLSVGDTVDVKVIKVDKQGRIDLSIKALSSSSEHNSKSSEDVENSDDDHKQSRRSGKRKQVGG